MTHPGLVYSCSSACSSARAARMSIGSSNACACSWMPIGSGEFPFVPSSNPPGIEMPQIPAMFALTV